MVDARRSRGLRICAAAVLTVEIAFGATVARADDAPAESEAHIQQGIALRGDGRNGQALAEFEKAYALFPTPRARAQVALALQALGDWLGAEAGLVEALGAKDDPWIAEYREPLEGALATVRAHLARLLVETSPPAAGELFVNGVRVQAMPLGEPIRVVAGTLEIEVRAEGYAPAHRRLELPPDGDVRQPIALEPLPSRASFLPAAPTPAEAPIRAGRPLGGYLALGAAGILAAGGIVAWRVREDNVATWNDDSQCLLGTTQSRGQQCSGVANNADIALGIEIGAFAAAVVSATIGAWLLFKPSPQPARKAVIACAPPYGLGVACWGAF
jgi:hypothetical protein